MGKQEVNDLPVEGWREFKKGTCVDKYQVRDLLIRNIENVKILAHKQGFSEDKESLKVTIEFHKEKVDPQTIEVLSRYEEAINSVPYKEAETYAPGTKVKLPNGLIVIVESMQKVGNENNKG